MARSQTVREVKKEAERRSRERKRFYVNVHGSLDLKQAGAMSDGKCILWYCCLISMFFGIFGIPSIA